MVAVDRGTKRFKDPEDCVILVGNFRGVIVESLDKHLLVTVNLKDNLYFAIKKHKRNAGNLHQQENRVADFSKTIVDKQGWLDIVVLKVAKMPTTYFLDNALGSDLSEVNYPRAHEIEDFYGDLVGNV